MGPKRDATEGMKSAYELALERLEGQGIEPPREEALSAETKAEMTEARQKAQARLAELEILHRDTLGGAPDPESRQRAEEEYLLERRRIEDRRDRELARLRGDE